MSTLEELQADHDRERAAATAAAEIQASTEAGRPIAQEGLRKSIDALTTLNEKLVLGWETVAREFAALSENWNGIFSDYNEARRLLVQATDEGGYVGNSGDAELQAAWTAACVAPDVPSDFAAAATKLLHS